jgi:RNA polymerase sigma-70 factor (ECF subfamily)
VAKRKAGIDAGGDGEQTLVEQARAGDREALGELFLLHAPAVRRLLTSVVGPTNELDDLAQEVFLQVHRSLRGFRGESRFGTWLHRVTVHTAISHLRRRRAWVLPLEPEALDGLAVERGADACDRAAGREMVRRLYRILDGLTHRRRVAWILFEVEGRPIAEVAAILGVPSAVAKSRIWFARREIRKTAAGDEVLGPLLKELER